MKRKRRYIHICRFPINRFYNRTYQNRPDLISALVQPLNKVFLMVHCNFGAELKNRGTFRGKNREKS